MEPINITITRLKSEAAAYLNAAQKLQEAAELLEKFSTPANQIMMAAKPEIKAPQADLFTPAPLYPKTFETPTASTPKRRENKTGVGKAFKRLLFTKYINTGEPISLTIAKAEMKDMYPNFNKSTFFNSIYELKKDGYRVLKKRKQGGETQYLIKAPALDAVPV